MKVEYFIAKKLIFSRNVSTENGGNGTKTILRIATLGIALSLMVMLASVAIVTGFQKEIRAKVIGFGSHIQITAFNYNNVGVFQPIDKNQDFYDELKTEEGIRNIQVFATKEGIIKTEEELQGVIVKGVDKDFDWNFFKQNIIEGKAFSHLENDKNDSILISRNIANKMLLELHDKVVVYFIQNNKSRPRVFYVSGIYETGLQQFDDTYILADIRHVQKLNDWDENTVSGFEILLSNYEDLKNMDEYIYNYIPHDLNSLKISDRNRDIFGWLELQDMNVIIIIILMILVTGVSMSSAILVLILDRTKMIGVLKTLGAENWNIRKVFLAYSAYLLTVGIFWGNIIGLSLCFLQYKYQFVSLPQESYYISYVPINFDWQNIIIINTGTLLICTLMMIIPSSVVSKISPVKAIQFT